MNLTVNSTALAQELRLLNQIAPAKHALPILSHVLLRADEHLYLHATDLEVGFSTACRATVHEPGTAALPAKHLLDLVEQLPDADVLIAVEGKQVHIRSGAFRSRLQCLPAEDFPPPPAPEGDVVLLSAPALQGMIRRVRYAITDKAHASMLKGALLTVTEGAVGMVATDGKRLSVATATHARGGAAQAVVLTKALDAIAALFPTGEVGFSQSEQHLFFTEGHRLLYTRMAAGQFPGYQRIIPKDNNVRATAMRTSLASALRRVGLVSPENQSVYLEFGGDMLTLSSSSNEVGDAVEQIGITYAGEPLRLCVSARFLLDFLEAAESEVVVIDLKDGTTPLLVSDGAAFINVIMLVRA